MLGGGGLNFPFDQYYQGSLASRPGAVAGQALGDLGTLIPKLIQQHMSQKAMSDIQTQNPNDPVLKMLAPVLQANPGLVSDPSVVSALVRGESLLHRPRNQGQEMTPVAFGPQGLRTLSQGGMAGAGGAMTAGDISARPGEIQGQIPFKDAIAKMMSQAKTEDAQRKFESLVQQKTQTAIGPINDAVSTTDQLIQAYGNAQKSGEVGPVIGRIGENAAGLTGGKKFPKLYNYNKAKSALISTLFKGIGVNRFTMGEVQNLINSLPSGGEDPQRGMQVLQQFKDNLLLRRQQAQQDLESQLMIYRGIMAPGGFSEASPEINVNVPSPQNDMSQYEE